MFRSLLHRLGLYREEESRSKSRRVQHRHRVTLYLEALEGRLTPSVTFTVDDPGDDPAVVLTTGMTQGGNVTLRSAIQAANESTDDEITIDLQNVNGTITLGSALAALNNNIDIVGPGRDNLTVRRSTAENTDPFRIFTVNVNRECSIWNLTIANGYVPNAAGQLADNGGGIRNDGDLAVFNVNLVGNQAINGGAIFSTGGLLVSNCNLYTNSSDSHGGAIYNAGQATIQNNTTITINSAGGNGGGVFNALGSLTLSGIWISENSATGNGGGVYNRGTTTATDSTISMNSATNGGGGYGAANSSISATGCTIVDNMATGVGTALSWAPNMSYTVSNCTLNGTFTQDPNP